MRPTVDLKGVYHSETIPSQWNNFYLTLQTSIVSFRFNVVVTSNKLGMIYMSKSRIQRLELMLLLQEKYQMNSVQISDFLNSNNIKTPHNKTYNHKIVWSSIIKYKRRLNRFNNDKILDVKERILVAKL